MTEMQSMPSTPPPAQPPAGNGMAIAGMVLGIISAATCWIWCLPFIAVGCGIVGIILSVVALNQSKAKGGAGKGQAVAGLVCGIAGTVISALVWIVILPVANQAASTFGTEFQRAIREAEKAQKEELERQRQQLESEK